MKLISRLVNRPAKAMLSRALIPFGFDIRPVSTLADHHWMGLTERQIRTVLDIGACRGGFAETILMPRFPGAVIHSFEPTPDAFAPLSQRAEALGGRIIPHNIGLGDTEGQLSFNLAIDALPSSSLLPATTLSNQAFPQTVATRTIEVEIRRLDDIAVDLNIKDELVVKIDVQGFEDRVSRGGMETLKRAVGCIIEIQSANLYHGQPTFDDIYRLLVRLGFSFEGCLDQTFDANGQLLYFDGVFIRKPQA